MSPHLFEFMAISSEVIKGCKKSKKQAVKALYEDCAGWMLGVAVRYLSDRNEAMSIVNTAILAALENIKKFDTSKEEKIEAWLKTILVRKVIDYKRKNARTESENLNNNPSEVYIIKSFNAESTNQQDLLKMINLLPDRSRMVFNLFAIEGYKHSEISEMMGISEGTSKWHLAEARKKLQEMLLKLDDYPLTKSS